MLFHPLPANMGFSIGVSDVTAGENLTAEKEKLIAQATVDAAEMIQMARRGEIKNLAGRDADQTLEVMISGMLSKVRETLGDTCTRELSRHNAPLIMAVCGSKGALQSWTVATQRRYCADIESYIHRLQAKRRSDGRSRRPASISREPYS